MDGSGAPMIKAMLADGPMEGTTLEVEAVEGRPPKTIDVDESDSSRCRYCLAGWRQEGHTAVYSFLYHV